MVLCQPHLQITRTPSLRRISNAKPPLHHLYVPKERVLISTTTYNEKPNASGLTPDQTRALPERTIDPDGPDARIIRSLRELYSCKAQDRSYEIYAHDAVFHDPLGIERGKDSIRAQFDALPKVRPTRDYSEPDTTSDVVPALPALSLLHGFKLFPRSEIQKLRVLENPPGTSANLLLIDLDVAYFRNAQATSPFKVINSLLTLVLDDANQIIRHTEEWDHTRETTADDGFLGMLSEHRKRLTGAPSPTNLFLSRAGE